MKSVIIALITTFSMAAFADSVKLGSATLDQDASETTISAKKDAPVVSEVALTVSGEAVSIGEVVVVFRTGNGMGPYKAQKYKLNKFVSEGGSVTLELPDNGYPVRRIEIEGNAAGFGDARITAWGN